MIPYTYVPRYVKRKQSNHTIDAQRLCLEWKTERTHVHLNLIIRRRILYGFYCQSCISVFFLFVIIHWIGSMSVLQIGWCKKTIFHALEITAILCIILVYFFIFPDIPFLFSRFIFISLLFALILIQFLSLGIHNWIYDETIFGKFPKFMYGHHKCLQIAFYKRIHWTIAPVQLFQIGNIDWISINGSLAYFLLHFRKSAHGYVSLLWYTSILLLWWFAESHYSHSLDNITDPHLLKIILMIELSFPEKVRYIPVCIELQDSCYPRKCPRIYIPPTYGTFSFLLLNSLGFSIDPYCTYINSNGEFNLSSDLQWGPVSAPLFLFTFSDPHWSL